MLLSGWSISIFAVNDGACVITITSWIWKADVMAQWIALMHLIGLLSINVIVLSSYCISQKFIVRWFCYDFTFLARYIQFSEKSFQIHSVFLCIQYLFIIFINYVYSDYKILFYTSFSSVHQVPAYCEGPGWVMTNTCYNILSRGN